MIILLGALTSCRTSQITDVKPLQLETHFPSPYDQDGKAVVTFETDGSVKMPLWYWLEITEYVIDTESNRRLAE